MADLIGGEKINLVHAVIESDQWPMVETLAESRDIANGTAYTEKLKVKQTF